MTSTSRAWFARVERVEGEDERDDGMDARAFARAWTRARATREARNARDDMHEGESEFEDVEEEVKRERAFADVLERFRAKRDDDGRRAMVIREIYVEHLRRAVRRVGRMAKEKSSANGSSEMESSEMESSEMESSEMRSSDGGASASASDGGGGGESFAKRESRESIEREDVVAESTNGESAMIPPQTTTTTTTTTTTRRVASKPLTMRPRSKTLKLRRSPDEEAKSNEEGRSSDSCLRIDSDEESALRSPLADARERAMSSRHRTNGDSREDEERNGRLVTRAALKSTSRARFSSNERSPGEEGRIPTPRTSNKRLVRNALRSVCLAGPMNEAALTAAVAAVDSADEPSVVILLKGAANVAPKKMRGIYAVEGDTTMSLRRIYGGGPERIESADDVETAMKYDTSTQDFVSLANPDIVPLVAAITLSPGK